MPNYMKNGGEAKPTKPGKKTPMAKVVIDLDEPSEAKKAKMRQEIKDREMDENTRKGAKQYEGPDFPVPVQKAKGGMVSKGNGIAIRGTRKCKMY